MFADISWIVVTVSALIIYYDASNNKIGSIPGEKGFTNADAGMWATTTLLLWIIALPIYLLNRSQLIERAKTSPVEPSKWRNIIVVVLSVFVFLSLMNLAKNQESGYSSKTLRNSEQNYTESTPIKQNDEFNIQDKNIFSNGNFAVAIERIAKITPQELFNKGITVSASSITKSPYSNIGRICKLTGQVYKIEELPPKPNMPGQWSEILMLVNNPNSNLGQSTVDFIYQGDISEINSGKWITACGYFIGTYESENSLGGKVEALSLLGNVYAEFYYNNNY